MMVPPEIEHRADRLFGMSERLFLCIPFHHRLGQRWNQSREAPPSCASRTTEKLYWRTAEPRFRQPRSLRPAPLLAINGA